MAMIVPPIDESAPIRREAQGLVGVFRAMARTAETIKSSWKGLAALYSAPEEETVHSAMVKPDNYARTVKGHAETAYVALCNYDLPSCWHRFLKYSYNGKRTMDSNCL